MADVELAEHKERVRARFGESATDYVASPGHAAGEDLAQLAAWSEGADDRIALDVATGGGHTALALAARYGRVVATDLTERMLAAAESFIRGQGVVNVEFRVADAEALPFEAGTFDAVSCRIAPHHFPDPARFVAEVARVLKPGGLFLLEDSIVPADPALDAFLNRIEALRDRTHARTLSAEAGRELLAAAGLRIEAEATLPKPHPFADWVARSRTSEADRAALLATFRDASPEACAAFAIVLDDAGNAISFTDEKVLLKARKG